MKNKKSSILVAALSISFIFTSQNSFAQDLEVRTVEVDNFRESAKDASSNNDKLARDKKSTDTQSQANKSSDADSKTASDSANKGEDDLSSLDEEASEEVHFSNEQKEKLSQEGFSEERIANLEKSANYSKDEAKREEKPFDLNKFIEDAIKANKGNQGEDRSDQTGTKNDVDATTSATYYTKANWENKIKDKSRWKVEDDQNLVRVGGGDPVQMNDIDYDGTFVDANGRTVLRLVYKEKSQAVSAIWHRGLINFGDLDKYIDYDHSYVLGKDGKTQYKFEDVQNVLGKGFDLRSAVGDRTNNRSNLPINLVLREGVDLKKLGDQNYIVQMRLTDGNYKRVYAYAPNGTSMDYSTYTKTTSVDLADKLGNLFIKGGKQSDLNNATNQIGRAHV